MKKYRIETVKSFVEDIRDEIESKIQELEDLTESLVGEKSGSEEKRVLDYINNAVDKLTEGLSELETINHG